MTVAPGKDTTSALRALGARVGCELRSDRLSRLLYSTDASNYQVEPLVVAFPRDVSEVAEIIAAAADLGLPVLPRGAGTSLAGQGFREIKHAWDPSGIMNPGKVVPLEGALVRARSGSASPDPGGRGTRAGECAARRVLRGPPARRDDERRTARRPRPVPGVQGVRV